MSKDLLKEAIADAKAVRETAIANAKLALEEAFTPKLQSMLSKKIAEESEEFGDDEELADTAEAAVDMEADDSTDLGSAEETEEAVEDAGENGEAEGGEETDDTVHDNEEEDEDVYEEDVDNPTGADDNPALGDNAEEEDMELEAIIKELEDEAEEEPVEEPVEDEGLEEEKTEDPGDEIKDVEGDNNAKPLNITEDDEDEEEKDLDLEGVIKALQEEDEEEEEAKVEDDLEEAYKTIRFLKDKINEVNLLNAKLLFSNKLFRNNSLNESQKMKVIETFDRAGSVREVKLVYSTLAESISGYKRTKKRTVTEGFASKATRSTKPNKNVIVESNNFSSRMKKLAGLL